MRTRWQCPHSPAAVAGIHTHTHPFNGHFSGTTQVSRYRKVKPIWILLKQETVSGSGISWAICKSAPRSRQITTQFDTGRMPFLPPNQQRQSTEGTVAGTDQYLLPTAANLQQWVCCCRPELEQTNRSMDTVPLHRPGSAHSAGRANNVY